VLKALLLLLLQTEGGVWAEEDATLRSRVVRQLCDGSVRAGPKGDQAHNQGEGRRGRGRGEE
jgi:hypothetical protein